MPKTSGYQTGNNEGFSLIELSVVIGVMATSMAISIPVYQGMQERSMLEAAKASLSQMRTECVLNNSFNIPNNFSERSLKGYTLQSSSSNCNIIRAVANNNEKHPTFAYDFGTERITCSYKNSEATPYPECKKIGGKTTSSNNASQGEIVSQQKVDKTPKPIIDEYIANLDAQVEKELKAKEEALTKKKEEEQVLQAKFQEELGSRCGTSEDFANAKKNIARIKSSAYEISKMRNGPRGNNASTNAIHLYNDRIDYMLACREAMTGYGYPGGKFGKTSSSSQSGSSYARMSSISKVRVENMITNRYGTSTRYQGSLIALYDSAKRQADISLKNSKDPKMIAEVKAKNDAIQATWKKQQEAKQKRCAGPPKDLSRARQAQWAKRIGTSCLRIDLPKGLVNMEQIAINDQQKLSEIKSVLDGYQSLQSARNGFSGDINRFDKEYQEFEKYFWERCRRNNVNNYCR